MRRRSYLGGVAAGLVGTSGCAGLFGDGAADGSASWTQANHDGGNTNSVRGVDGPVSVSEARAPGLSPPMRYLDGVLFGIPDDDQGDVVGVDLESGEEVYSTSGKFGGPVFVADETVVVGLQNDSQEGLVSIDRASDADNWYTTNIDGVSVGRYAPVASENHIVAGRLEPEGYVCLDRGSGEQLWTYDTAADVYILLRPAVDDEYVYFTTLREAPSWDLVCLDVTTGDEEWRVEQRFDPLDWPEGVSGGGGSWDGPVRLGDDRVYLLSNRFRPQFDDDTRSTVDDLPGSDEILAFDRESGDRQWTAPLDGLGLGLGGVALAGERLYVFDSVWEGGGDSSGWTDDAIQVLDARSGERGWRTTVFEGRAVGHTRQVVATDAHIYAVAGGDIAVLERSDGTLLNTITPDRSVGRIIVTGDAVVAVVGERAESNREVLVLDGAD